MRNLSEIDADIEAAKLELQQVEGRETEIYSRIVGYYRSLRNWNKGKAEEFGDRRAFVGGSVDINADEVAEIDVDAEVEREAAAEAVKSYAYYYRKTCPSCGPVSDFVRQLPLEGVAVDVDSEEGSGEAVARGVYSTPTVVFLDGEGRSVFHGQSIAGLKDFCATLRDA